ncbi:MAG: hypothetical protein AAFV96_05580, partial [Pseudomonadota bacterium]
PAAAPDERRQQYRVEERMVLLSALIWGRSGTDHTLDALAERLDVVIPPAARHTAHGDAMATALVLTRLIPLLGTRHIATVEDAIAASSRIRA